MMIKEIEKKDGKIYQCGECGFLYEDKDIAEKCEAWCKEHKSCNLEIISNAIKKQ